MGENPAEASPEAARSRTGQPGGEATGTAQPVSNGSQAPSTPVTSTPAKISSKRGHKAVDTCVSKAKSVFKRMLKAAKHKHGKAKNRAIKAAAKQKSKRVGACRV